VSLDGAALPPQRRTARDSHRPGRGQDRAIVYHADVYRDRCGSRTEGDPQARSRRPVEPGPRGGFIVARPEPENASNIEIVAFGKDLKEVWRKKYTALQNEIAAKLGKPPGDVAFNDTSTSHLPPTGEPAWVGITLVFSDVGWKEGIPDYYVRLDAASAATLSAVHGIGLSGKPAGGEKSILAVLAPDAKAGLPPPAPVVSLEDGRPPRKSVSAHEGASTAIRSIRAAATGALRERAGDALWIYGGEARPSKVIDLKMTPGGP
jgi:hypothetical protein